MSARYRLKKPGNGGCELDADNLSKTIFDLVVCFRGEEDYEHDIYLPRMAWGRRHGEASVPRLLAVTHYIATLGTISVDARMSKAIA